LFFAVSSFRVLSHCSSTSVCLFRPEEDDVISVTSSTQSASLVISNLVSLHKLIPRFRFRINITGMPTLRTRGFALILKPPYLHSSTRGFSKVPWKQPDR
jgi:hypothetical protein